MATIDKKLIHFKSLSDFEARLAAGDILSTSIVWIKDAKKIWTHGEYYDCNGGGDNVYIFNPEGTPSEEYAGLQDAVNNGKQVVIWAEDGGISSVVCTVIYGYYTENAYYVMFSYTVAGNNEGTIFYNSVNVSETSIDVVGNIASPVITGVDSALNINSTNPVQNKVVLEALGTVAEQANSKQAQLVSGTNIKTINGESILGSGNIAIEGGETLTEADILAMGFTKNAGTITGVSINGTTIANNGNVFLPNASTSAYGVTKLSSATNSTSTTLAATPSAVKAAYDLANTKVSWLDGDVIYANGLQDESGEVYITPGAVEMGVEGTILATQSYVDNAVANAGGGGSGSYVPMPETFIEQGATLEHTLSPNTSLYAFLVGAGRVYIDLQEPTSFDVVNEYTMIFRTFGFGNAITIDKTIIWANDNPPVLDDSVNEFLEISVKCINSPMYNGVQYLGTWTKYNV